ncbi:hypothetical protein [Vaccinia virus]|nr:hypothetical protein [Vaccinia virus]
MDVNVLVGNFLTLVEIKILMDYVLLISSDNMLISDTNGFNISMIYGRLSFGLI